MKTQSDIRTEVTNLIREWDYQDDTYDKLSHIDLAVKIEDVYLKYTTYCCEKTLEYASDNINGHQNWRDYKQDVLHSKIVFP